ncbi:hypothetical protein OG754_00245 [Streptomyces decoyicus]|uniref:hypothetical protein n=1 Tax=Streptomyces decoyicus TaxID=249567 RepID=UPI002E37F8A0|nr:hypothetical protein [Streptomyces decoyicus]
MHGQGELGAEEPLRTHSFSPGRGVKAARQVEGLRLDGAGAHHGGGHDSGGTPGRRTVRDGVVLGLLLTYQIFLDEEALLPDAARRGSDMQGG